MRARKRLRLQGFDYSTNNAYFLTVCTHLRRAIFVDDRKEVAERELIALPHRFNGLTIDCWKLQPDHLHAIVLLVDCSATVSVIMQAYKSITANVLREIGVEARVWQRGFHDRIVRSEAELSELRKYITHNEVVHAVRAGRDRV